jgi:hypothetical protein
VFVGVCGVCVGGCGGGGCVYKVAQ